MSNSTDGNKVSILAGQTQQASEDRIAERIAAAVSRTKLDSLDKVMAARSAADAAQNAKRRLTIKYGYALEAVYKLWWQFRPDPAGGRKPVPSHAGVGVRSVGNFDYGIAEFVQLILGDKLDPASLKACVELLQRAEKYNIAPKNFRRFQRNVGGIDVIAKIVNNLS